MNNITRDTHSYDVNETQCQATQSSNMISGSQTNLDVTSLIPLEHIALHLTYLWLILELLLYIGSRKSNICKVRTDEINGMYLNISNFNPILSSCSKRFPPKVIDSYQIAVFVLEQHRHTSTSSVCSLLQAIPWRNEISQCIMQHPAQNGFQF